MATRVIKDLNLFTKKTKQHEKKIKILDLQKKNHIKGKYGEKISQNINVNEFFFDDEDDIMTPQQIQNKKIESKEKLNYFQNLISGVEI